jgi:hypothetical protein
MPPVDKKTKGFSKGEKDLYREISKINDREGKIIQDMKEKTAAFFAKKSYGRAMPTPTMK